MNAARPWKVTPLLPAFAGAGAERVAVDVESALSTEGNLVSPLRADRWLLTASHRIVGSPDCRSARPIRLAVVPADLQPSALGTPPSSAVVDRQHEYLGVWRRPLFAVMSPLGRVDGVALTDPTLMPGWCTPSRKRQASSP
jgi:hypothetical protein